MSAPAEAHWRVSHCDIGEDHKVSGAPAVSAVTDLPGGLPDDATLRRLRTEGWTQRLIAETFGASEADVWAALQWAGYSQHFPMPLNADGQGPEMDVTKVVTTVCWSCEPVQEWPLHGRRRPARLVTCSSVPRVAQAVCPPDA